MPRQLDLLFASADAAQQAEAFTIHLQLTAAALSLYTPQTTSGKGNDECQMTKCAFTKLSQVIVAKNHYMHVTCIW